MTACTEIESQTYQAEIDEQQREILIKQFVKCGERWMKNRIAQITIQGRVNKS